MIDWIGKLPEGAIAILAGAGLWFGFNYTVLAERAMDRDLTAHTVPACESMLGAKQSQRDGPRIGLGTLFGMPELDELEERLSAAAMPPLLSQAQITGRCVCAAALSAAGLRFDYALHTASFRLLPVEKAAAARADAMELATLGTCDGEAL